MAVNRNRFKGQVCFVSNCFLLLIYNLYIVIELNYFYLNEQRGYWKSLDDFALSFYIYILITCILIVGMVFGLVLLNAVEKRQIIEIKQNLVELKESLRKGQCHHKEDVRKLYRHK